MSKNKSYEGKKRGPKGASLINKLRTVAWIHGIRRYVSDGEKLISWTQLSSLLDVTPRQVLNYREGKQVPEIFRVKTKIKKDSIKYTALSNHAPNLVNTGDSKYGHWIFKNGILGSKLWDAIEGNAEHCGQATADIVKETAEMFSLDEHDRDAYLVRLLCIALWKYHDAYDFEEGKAFDEVVEAEKNVQGVLESFGVAEEDISAIAQYYKESIAS